MGYPFLKYLIIDCIIVRTYYYRLKMESHGSGLAYLRSTLQNRKYPDVKYLRLEII